MRKNGFTLIELLAVIVILAIIALIATPIILGIINDAREESNERSVELYASAVRNGIAAYQLREGKEVLPGTYNESNPLPFKPEYEGKVDCTNIIIGEDGKVSLEGCTVNGGTKEYSYGVKEEKTQVYKPQYYAYTELSGTVGTTAVPASPSSVPPTGEIRYLGYDVTDGIISTAYVCFVRNETEYCLKGTTDGSSFGTNNEVLEDAFKDVENACSFGDYSSCSAGGLFVPVNPTGDVYAYVGEDECHVYVDGSFGCLKY